jgi:tetratricopeptide (TPR) repeat protein
MAYGSVRLRAREEKMKTFAIGAAFVLGLTKAYAADADMANMAMPMTPPGPAVYMGESEKPGAPVFADLGKHTHKIATENAETQRYFDQGINLLFGFNHAEAIRSFREAARLDPKCAICWWGVSFAYGSNINLPIQPDAIKPAWDALQKAAALEPYASKEEKAWIAALKDRYSSDPAADRGILDDAFAKAMIQVAKDHPNDPDAAVFAAEAMMDTQPWDYWDVDGKTPKGYGAQIVATLENVIKRQPDHPGALHLYIHAVEASTTPERAEPAADRLASLMPDAGHIVHMPSHIFYRVGRYADAYRANERAASVDEKYIAACRAQGFYPLGYYGHNIHFLWTSAEMEGRYQAALDASRRLNRATEAEKIAGQIPQGQLYIYTPIATYLRFGKWNEILAEPMPSPEYQLDTAMALLARGFAYANTGDLAKAKDARDKIDELRKAGMPELEAVMVPGTQIAEVALYELDGEIARKSGKLDDAIVYFRRAQDAERNLPYTEPAYWHQPVAHLLGAALLETGKPADAEAVYRHSLTVYRRDGWALYGLALALKAQGKAAEADAARKEFDSAWQFADVRLETSRF